MLFRKIPRGTIEGGEKLFFGGRWEPASAKSLVSWASTLQGSLKWIQRPASLYSRLLALPLNEKQIPKLLKTQRSQSE